MYRQAPLFSVEVVCLFWGQNLAYIKEVVLQNVSIEKSKQV